MACCNYQAHPDANTTATSYPVESADSGVCRGDLGTQGASVGRERSRRHSRRPTAFEERTVVSRLSRPYYVIQTRSKSRTTIVPYCKPKFCEYLLVEAEAAIHQKSVLSPLALVELYTTISCLINQQTDKLKAEEHGGSISSRYFESRSCNERVRPRRTYCITSIFSLLRPSILFCHSSRHYIYISKYFALFICFVCWRQG